MSYGLKIAGQADAKVSDAEVEELKSGSWSVDCPHLELRRRADSSCLLAGPGCVWQDADGRLAYKIYAPSADEGTDSVMGAWEDPGQAGTTMPEDS